jgi:hypothetical protein
VLVVDAEELVADFVLEVARVLEALVEEEALALLYGLVLCALLRECDNLR